MEENEAIEILPLTHILLPSGQDSSDFINICGGQFKHLEVLAAKFYKDHKLPEKRLPYKKFLAFVIMCFLSGRLTTLFEITGEAPNNNEEIVGLPTVIDELKNELNNDKE